MVHGEVAGLKNGEPVMAGVLGVLQSKVFSTDSTIHTLPRALMAARPLADVPRRGPVPKLLWADLFFSDLAHLNLMSVRIRFCRQKPDPVGEKSPPM